MKRILLLFAGYILIVQAGLFGLLTLGAPQYAIFILPIAVFSGWAGYKLIVIGRASAKPHQPNVSETQRIPR